MQKFIKGMGPSGQLFETVNFGLMKIFDFFVKIALFWASLLLLGDTCHKLRPKIELSGYLSSSIIKPPSSISAVTRGANHPRKSRKAPKMAILTKKSKIFIKAKLTVSKS